MYNSSLFTFKPNHDLSQFSELTEEELQENEPERESLESRSEEGSSEQDEQASLSEESQEQGLATITMDSGHEGKGWATQCTRAESSVEEEGN